MTDTVLFQEFQEFSKRTTELQQQYLSLVNQALPSKEVDSRSLSRIKYEIDTLSEYSTIYHSVGKMFLISDIASTHKMIDTSLESNKRTVSILLERKSVLEKALKEAEEKHKFYLSKLNGVQ